MPVNSASGNDSANGGMPQSPHNSGPRSPAPPPPMPRFPWALFGIGVALLLCIIGGITLIKALEHRPSQNKTEQARDTGDITGSIQSLSNGSSSVPAQPGGAAQDPVGSIGGVTSGKVPIPPAQQTQPVPLDPKPNPDKDKGADGATPGGDGDVIRQIKEKMHR